MCSGLYSLLCYREGEISLSLLILKKSKGETITASLYLLSLISYCKVLLTLEWCQRLVQHSVDTNIQFVKKKKCSICEAQHGRT